VPARSCTAQAADARGGCPPSILEAAAELMAEIGFGAMSMRQLASRVGMLPGSLYHHVTGKQDLLLLVLMDVLDRRLAAWRVRRNKRELRTYLEYVLARQCSHPLEEVLLRHEARHLLDDQRRWLEQRLERLKAPLLAIIEQGQRSGRFRVMDRRTAVAGILAVVNAAADLRSSGLDEASLQAWALRVCLRILTSP
jgi:AcrR family transcriptional regulator